MPGWNYSSVLTGTETAEPLDQIQQLHLSITKYHLSKKLLKDVSEITHCWVTDHREHPLGYSHQNLTCCPLWAPCSKPGHKNKQKCKPLFWSRFRNSGWWKMRYLQKVGNPWSLRSLLRSLTRLLFILQLASYSSLALLSQSAHS